MKEYIMTLAAVAIFSSLCALIMPEGSFKKYTNLICSLVIIAVMLKPLSNGDALLNAVESFDFEVPNMTAQDAQNEYSKIMLDAHGDRVKKDIEQNFPDCTAIVDVEAGGSVAKVSVYGTTDPEKLRTYIKEHWSPKEVLLY